MDNASIIPFTKPRSATGCRWRSTPVPKGAAYRERLIVQVKGMGFGIFYVGGQYYACRNGCPRIGAPICNGPVSGTKVHSKVYEYKYGRDREILRCPWHGWEFDLTTGASLADPQVKLRGCEPAVEGDSLYLIL